MTAAGSRRARPATPTAVDPPWSYANTPSATKWAHSAETDAPQAISARRTSALPAATRSEAHASPTRDTRRERATGPYRTGAGLAALSGLAQRLLVDGEVEAELVPRCLAGPDRLL